MRTRYQLIAGMDNGNLYNGVVMLTIYFLIKQLTKTLFSVETLVFLSPQSRTLLLVKCYSVSRKS